MKSKIKATITVIVLLILMLNSLMLASALTIRSLTTTTITPGDQGDIFFDIENNLGIDAEEVSVTLFFENLPFTPIGSSESSIDEIKNNKEESFRFKIKAANDIKPGDYQIPYKISYTTNNSQTIQTRQGTLGLTVKADPELTFSLSADNPILNRKGEITLRIVNKGFADAKFLTLNVVSDPLSYNLLSDNEIYIGNVDSDDFETATFDVIYTNKDPIFTVIVEYKNFDNSLVRKTITLPIKVYTEEEALKLGLITKSNAPLYVGIAIALIVLWFIYRAIRKSIRRRARRNNK